jgi:hypothetical protein
MRMLGAGDPTHVTDEVVMRTQAYMALSDAADPMNDDPIRIAAFRDLMLQDDASRRDVLHGLVIPFVASVKNARNLSLAINEHVCKDLGMRLDAWIKELQKAPDYTGGAALPARFDVYSIVMKGDLMSADQTLLLEPGTDSVEPGTRPTAAPLHMRRALALATVPPTP